MTKFETRALYSMLSTEQCVKLHAIHLFGSQKDFENEVKSLCKMYAEPMQAVKANFERKEAENAGA